MKPKFCGGGGGVFGFVVIPICSNGDVNTTSYAAMVTIFKM